MALHAQVAHEMWRVVDVAAEAVVHVNDHDGATTTWSEIGHVPKLVGRPTNGVALGVTI